MILSSYKNNSKIIKKSTEAINKFTNDKLMTFKNNSICEKNVSLFEQIKVDYNLEIELLEQIFLLEETLSLNFHSFNWPRGYRFESSFYALVLFDVNGENLDVNKNSYVIKIDEDLLNKKRNRVLFCDLNWSKEVSINEVFAGLGKTIIYDNSINHELHLLGFLEAQELILIGNLFFKEELLLEYPEEVKNSVKVNSVTFNAYLKLLKLKHHFILLRRIESSAYSLVEGIIPFELMYQSKCVFNGIGEDFLTIRIYNKYTNRIYFVHEGNVYSFIDILKFAGIKEMNNCNEFEQLLNFSNYDLNILSLILKDIVGF